VAKKNAFTPDMMARLSDAFTAFDGDDELWVAVLAFAGEHTTAGLDMPKFFGPNAERRDSPPGNVDPFALKRRTLKPVVAAVQGLCLTVGIEMMLAADIVIAADTSRFAKWSPSAASRPWVAPISAF
jgi:Enoyl-CoA hydratase/carnithine racemase